MSSPNRSWKHLNLRRRTIGEIWAYCPHANPRIKVNMIRVTGVRDCRLSSPDDVTYVVSYSRHRQYCAPARTHFYNRIFIPLAIMKSMSLYLIVPLLINLSEASPQFPAFAPKAIGSAGTSQCKLASADAAWPKAPAWSSALPNVKASTSKGPNYKVAVSKVKDVQDAVNFAAKNNIRFSIMNSGHDFMKR
jgi:hypothetical protein